MTLHGEYAYEQNEYQGHQAIAAASLGVAWNAFDGGRNRHEAKSYAGQAEALRDARTSSRSSPWTFAGRGWTWPKRGIAYW